MNKQKREYADCYFCGGEVTEKNINVLRHWKGHLLLIENIPAGVCNQCGEQYFWSNVSEEMDRIMQSSESELTIKREISVPVVEFTGS